jgi:ABC-type uncharacterized transport system YnjBCD substrate-binding protein
MKKIFLIIGIVSVLTSASQASEWKIISNELTGYNFYTNKIIKGGNF